MFEKLALPILALGFLIVVHEFGHYIVARWCKMRVERFSVGFGPGIFKYRSKKTGTVFQLAPIPFGGFVEIRGMNIVEEVDPDDPAAYPNRPAWQRFLTILAGPATNYLSAVVIAFALFTCHGVESPDWYSYVETVSKEHDAAGKLEPGDRILKVDDVPLIAGQLTERVVAKQGAPMKLLVRRGVQELEVTITPKLALGADGKPEKDKKGRDIYRLGLSQHYKPDVFEVGVLEAGWEAVKYPVVQSKVIIIGLYKIITGAEKADPGGPVRIVDEFGKAFERGMIEGIRLLMMLSVYLGLFNLLPVPALDGARLVFLGYEMVTRRRANAKVEATVHMGGIMLIGIAMILVTFRDCSNL